ncbi:sodium-dependent transporter [Marinomonas algarum]|uniref:Transporter n=1 Tax=Marinomonas algarum TaxID=2883105 RepID=A0A9X1IKJ5_9GAMM|nr:sodium-dependent transporter [Marinomonas algarum]MCB5160895.1 sodium-dependent transporter [Marinomonas algarum]
MTNKTSIHGSWASRWIFILAATGSAVGLGNIWKFPYITGENGGGAFVLVYLACILLVGIPIMMAEVFIGRRARKNPIDAMSDLATESDSPKAWGLVGTMAMISGLLILSFYSVVGGWVLHYLKIMLSGDMIGATSAQAGTAFDNLLADPAMLLAWHTLFCAMTVSVVAIGINKGIETATRIMMPALFVLLLVLLGYAITTDGFAQGWDFMFKFDFDKLTWGAALIALGHSFFTLSLGMAIIMAYGSYMTKDASIGKTVLTIGILDTLVALVAGLAIFPIIFSNGMDPAAGPGLMFISLPVAFGQMPFGQLFGVLFFVLVGVAAWTSAISLLEPSVAFLVERFGLKRPTAAIGIGVGIWALGIACLASFNLTSDVTFFGKNTFDFLDYITANIMLPLGGILTALFAGWVVKAKFSQDELQLPSVLFKAWSISVKFTAPVAVAVVLYFLLNPIK